MGPGPGGMGPGGAGPGGNSAGQSNTTRELVITNPEFPPGTTDLPTLVSAVRELRNSGTLIKGVTLPKESKEAFVVAGFGWMVHLLPHIGQDDLYKKFTFDKPWLDESNLKYSVDIIPTFLSARNTQQRLQGFPFIGIGPGMTHYVGMSGIEDARNVVAAKLLRTDDRAGIFGYDDIARPEQITDGQSQTIMMIEVGKMASAWVAGGGATIRGARESYFDSLTGFGPTNTTDDVQVLFADGSVRSVSKAIDPSVFRAMCTIHGGETVDVGQMPVVSGASP